jgi:Stage II sporulation protein M
MSPAALADARRVLKLALLATAVAAAAALAVRVLFAADARTVLGFSFPGVAAELGEAASIFTNNTRKVAGIFGLALVLQSPWLSGQRAREDRPRWHPALATVCDFAVAGVLASTVAAVVLGLGGYGMRMVAALLPHGPVEVTAFAAAIVLYLAARRQPIAAGRAVTLAAASVALLAIAALLEAFLPL